MKIILLFTGKQKSKQLVDSWKIIKKKRDEEEEARCLLEEKVADWKQLLSHTDLKTKLFKYLDSSQVSLETIQRVVDVQTASSD